MAAVFLFLALLTLEPCASLKFAGEAESELVGGNQLSRPNRVSLNYLWPSGRGRVGRYTTSESQAPVNLTASFSWMWHDPRGKYAGSPVGTVIDDKQDIYLTCLDSIRKFNQWGKLLWEYKPARENGDELPKTASLYDGALYGSTTSGHVFAISMQSGRQLWFKKVWSNKANKAKSIDGSNGWVSVFDGIVITGYDAQSLDDQEVIGLSVADGSVVWRFHPNAPISHFMASFAGDGTFIFQDNEGRAYRCRASDGQLIWKNGGITDTWTDGSALLGPNGKVYTVNSYQLNKDNPYSPGEVCAYNFQDGALLWKTTVPYPPHNMPAIGKLARHTGLSVVQPIGLPGHTGSPTDVWALDADTGEVQWIFNGPTHEKSSKPAAEGMFARATRAVTGVQPTTTPSTWSSPSIDGLGTVYIGNQEGQIFALRDEDGDKKIAGAQEVSMYDANAAFSVGSAPAIGKDMIAMASIDALYVFKR